MLRVKGAIERPRAVTLESAPEVPITTLDEAAEYLFEKHQELSLTRKLENFKIWMNILYSDRFSMSLDEFVKSEECMHQERLYGDFTRRFRGMLVEGMRSLRDQKDDESVLLKGMKIGSGLLELIPVVGGVLSLVAKGGTEVYAQLSSKKAYRAFLDRVSSLGGHGESDKIVEDFVYRMTLYHREDVLTANTDKTLIQKVKDFIGKFTDPRNPTFMEQGWKYFKEKFIEGDTGCPRAVFCPKHWDDVIANAVAQFLVILMDETKKIKIDANFGIAAANKVSPIRIDMLRERTIELLPDSSHNIHNMAIFTQLAYSSEATISDVLKRWKFVDHRVYRDSKFQAFITRDSEKIVLSFRG